VPLIDAQKRAYDQSLDLVLIDIKNDPPVCKIMDYGKFKFERDKKEREAKTQQHIVELKEIQFTPQIGAGDLDTKTNMARRFLTEGNKVKLVIKYRGRQMAHQELGVSVLNKVKEICADLGLPDKAANLEGKNLILILSPIKK
jgi:translation initiation factor IF-3